MYTGSGVQDCARFCHICMSRFITWNRITSSHLTPTAQRCSKVSRPRLCVTYRAYSILGDVKYALCGAREIHVHMQTEDESDTVYYCCRDGNAIADFMTSVAMSSYPLRKHDK